MGKKIILKNDENMGLLCNKLFVICKVAGIYWLEDHGSKFGFFLLGIN